MTALLHVLLIVVTRFGQTGCQRCLKFRTIAEAQTVFLTDIHER